MGYGVWGMGCRSVGVRRRVYFVAPNPSTAIFSPHITIQGLGSRVTNLVSWVDLCDVFGV